MIKKINVDDMIAAADIIIKRKAREIFKIKKELEFAIANKKLLKAIKGDNNE